MTKHYDYALMSDFVYKLGDIEYKNYDKNPERYSNNEDYLEYKNQKNEILKNWALISTSQDYKIGTDVDYFGATFKHKETNQIVIAHRGTIINFSGPSPNVIEDLKIFGRKTPELILKPCIDYIKEALVETKANNNTKITMTGHSLGGYLAGVSTLIFRAKTDYQKINAVTFDSIGIKAFLDEFKKELNQEQTANANLSNIEDNILNYLSSPNIINTILEHIGKNRRLFLENDPIDSIRKSLFPAFQNIQKKNESFRSLGELDRINNISLTISCLDILATLYSHPMANFLSAFDKKGGFPKGNYGKITQWPSGNYGFFERKPEYIMTNHNQDKLEKYILNLFKLMTTPEFIEQNIKPIIRLVINANTDRQSEDEYSSEEANNINLNP